MNELDYGAKLELMRNEVNRVYQEYLFDEVCWDEFSCDVHLDPRLDLQSQVQVYGELCQKIDGDRLVRELYDNDEDEPYEVEVQGVNMGDPSNENH